MNKKLISLAVSTVLVGSTSAFADVTVYGQLHMSMDYTNSKTKPAAADVSRKSNLSVSSNSSRLGFKGNEDVGSGLKAVWQIESAVGMDEGAGTSPSLTDMNKKTYSIGSRNSYLGLAGDFGTFLLGKHDTPFKMFSRSLDPFTDTIADTRQLLGNQQEYGTSTWELRPANVVAYITPNFSGFGAVVAYVTGLNEGISYDTKGNMISGGADNNKLTAISMNATYKNGPIYVGAAYESHNIKNLGGANANSPSAWRLGGSYTFGPATIGGMWEQISDYDLVKAERSGGTLFGTYTFGMETIKLAYTAVGERKKALAGKDIKDSDASLWAIGVDHKFSKRTTAYAQYTAMNNNSKAMYSLGSGGGYGDPVEPAIGKDPNAFSVGLIHKF